MEWIHLAQGRDLWQAVMDVTVDLQVLQNMLFQKGHSILGLLCMSPQLDPSKWPMPSEPVTCRETERNCEGLDPFFIQRTSEECFQFP